MEDPTLIATLIPTDPRNLAEKAFLRPENRPRYLKPAESIADSSTTSATSAQDQRDGNSDDYDFAHRIRLRTTDELKNPVRGIAFGSDPETCDVLLPGNVQRGISGLHFWITFDENRQLLLRDCSTCGTAVSYDRQAQDEVRRNFTWMLGLVKEHGHWDVRVHVPHKKGLAFKIQLASHNTCQAEFNAEVDRNLAASRDPLAATNVLNIKSLASTALPSQYLSSRRRPVYIQEQKIGSGAYAIVYKIINVSTGCVYAGKYFYRSKKPEKDWLQRIRREVRIMTNICHDHLVHALDATEQPTLLLVLPYFSLGSLEDQQQITLTETTCVLRQGLQALEYLHSYKLDKKRIVHRDIKPANILLVSRFPFHIKLADFGFAQDCSDLIRVVVLQYAYDLPNGAAQTERQGSSRPVARTWCEQLVDEVNHGDFHPLKDLLSAHMLRIEARERLSADRCLKQASELGVFDDLISERGSVTPTQQTLMKNVMSNDDGSATVTLGALEGGEETSNVRDGIKDMSHGAHDTTKILELPTAQVPRGAKSSSSDKFPPAGEEWAGRVEPSVNLQTVPAEAQAPYPLSRKRQRKKAAASSNKSSGRGRIERQRPDGRRKGRPFSRTYAVLGKYMDKDAKPTQFGAMYDAVLELLTDLQPGESARQALDDHTSALVRNVCDHFTRLNITRIGLIKDEHSRNVTITATSNSREVVLASLATFESMGSTADLAEHFIHILQMQSPQLRNTPTEPVSDPAMQTESIPLGDGHSSLETDQAGSETMTSTQRYGLTYPSALLDVTNVSGCSTPDAGCS
ncbi:MAG: hypothetical protein M1837_005123 [Sclerophora amabilis]|nr:MAG: hypothetical protein M1837_005123 [Sclerophora amabilis]